MKKEFVFLLFIFPLVLLYLFPEYVKKKSNYKIHLTLEDSFQKLQGVDTDDWNYIQTKQDKTSLAMYETLYEKNKHFQFNLNPTFKIPQKVHLIWIGPRPFPQKSVENVRSWIAYHPDWTFVFWTDRKRPPPCNGMEMKLLEDFEFQFLKNHYQESQNWAEKSDIWRYEILYQEGGLYIDHDTKCYRPFHNLHSGYDLYVGLEMPHQGIDGLAVTVGNAIIGAKPYHPVIERTIQNVLERWNRVTLQFNAKDPVSQATKVVHRTLIALTYAFEERLSLLENTDIAFPACYFFPKHGLPAFYSEHLYATTWHNLDQTFSEKYVLKALKGIRRWSQKIFQIELISLILLFACFALYLAINKEIKKRLK